MKKLKDVIVDQEHWCKDYAAIDKNGNSVLPSDEDACKFCLSGAIIKNAPSNNNDWIWILEAIIVRKYPNRLKPFSLDSKIIQFNDHPETQWHEVLEVIEAFDEIPK